MKRKFDELLRQRCMHCGKWVERCSLYTLDESIDKYGEYCICLNCFKKHKSDDIEYWKNWIKKKEVDNK